MRVVVESKLTCQADLVWEAVQTTALFQDVAYPLVTVRGESNSPLPRRWPLGGKVECQTYLLGFIPFGKRTLYFERIDQTAFEIQTRECDPLISRWDHLIRVRPEGETECRYRDEIEIEAGWRTPLVWLFAQVFYRHRQRRWRRVARRLAKSHAPGAARVPAGP